MSFSAKNYDFKGETCIELIAGDFRAEPKLYAAR